MKYDPRWCRNRLHILQRFHDYLAKQEAGQGARLRRSPPLAGARLRGFLVKSDALTERVFTSKSRGHLVPAGHRPVQLKRRKMQPRYEYGDAVRDPQRATTAPSRHESG